MCLLFQNLGGAAGGAVEHLRGAVLCSSLSGKMVARRLTTLVASGCDVGSVQTRDRRSGRMQINVVRSDGFEASEVQPTYKASWDLGEMHPSMLLVDKVSEEWVCRDKRAGSRRSGRIT